MHIKTPSDLHRTHEIAELRAVLLIVHRGPGVDVRQVYLLERAARAYYEQLKVVLRHSLSDRVDLPVTHFGDLRLTRKLREPHVLRSDPLGLDQRLLER